MNVDRLNHLANVIEQIGRVDLGTFIAVHGQSTYGLRADRITWDCNTTGCVAGWACAVWAPDTTDRFFAVGMDVLGLTYSEAESLFFNDNDVWFRAMDVQPEHDDDGHLIANDSYRKMCVDPVRVASMLRRIASGELEL